MQYLLVSTWITAARGARVLITKNAPCQTSSSLASQPTESPFCITATADSVGHAGVVVGRCGRGGERIAHTHTRTHALAHIASHASYASHARTTRPHTTHTHTHTRSSRPCVTYTHTSTLFIIKEARPLHIRTRVCKVAARFCVLGGVGAAMYGLEA